MLNKPFFLILFILIACQILFSFYYSSEIINQNNSINKNQSSLQSLKIANQELKKQFTSLTSLSQIQTLINQKNYINLKETLNLQN
ncbi:MAG: hypothetical protein PHE32_02160 [Candidatus Shapirobacteria bacterium]|nr:hypothetical protein [Candidatus Shapirobacteria bacterium]MDD4410474.1 hypothetical protein [Candidatus Shapirobacteria bacterium]